MNFADGILLGLSTGFVCLAYCGPVLIPFLLGENKSIAGNTLNVVLFLSGRLLAYIITGLAAGIIGLNYVGQLGPDVLFLGLIYILLSFLLIGYGFYRFREICLGTIQKKIISKYFSNLPLLRECGNAHPRVKAISIIRNPKPLFHDELFLVKSYIKV